MKTLTLADVILNASWEVEDNRSKYYVLSKVGEEFGELSTEVGIVMGDSYKDPGKDGVIGEAIDVIISTLDLIYLEKPMITEEELIAIAIPKLEKWKAKVKARQDAIRTNTN